MSDFRYRWHDPDKRPSLSQLAESEGSDEKCPYCGPFTCRHPDDCWYEQGDEDESNEDQERGARPQGDRTLGGATPRTLPTREDRTR